MYKYLMVGGGIKKMKSGSSQWCPVTGKKTMGKNFFLKKKTTINLNLELFTYLFIYFNVRTIEHLSMLTREGVGSPY